MHKNGNVKKVSYIKIAAILLVFAMLVTVLSGCGAKQAEDESRSNASAEVENVVMADSLAVIYSQHLNATKVKLSSFERDKIQHVAEVGGYMVLIPVDGDSQQFEEGFTLGSSAQTESRRAQEIEKQVTGVEAVIETSLLADAEQIDLYRAFQNAANALYDAPGVREILVIDPMLSTKDYLDFTTGMLNATPDEVVSFLKANDALLPLQGIIITIVGIGNVSGAQAPLNPHQAKNLGDIWAAVLNASGAESVTVKQSLAGEPVTDAPYVTPVPVEGVAVFTKESIASGDFKYGDDVVSFVPDQAVYLDPDAANAALEPLYQYLSGNPDITISIYGTNASDGFAKSSHSSLSQTRAETVSSSLIDMGLEAGRITTIQGLGNDNIWHVDDVDKYGNQTMEAWKNRSVHIVIDGSPTSNLLAND